MYTESSVYIPVYFADYTVLWFLGSCPVDVTLVPALCMWHQAPPYKRTLDNAQSCRQPADADSAVPQPLYHAKGDVSVTSMPSAVYVATTRKKSKNGGPRRTPEGLRPQHPQRGGRRGGPTPGNTGRGRQRDFKRA
jgi:hypothetical protein